MPLIMEVKSPYGETHEIRVTYDKDAEELSVELTGHDDPNYDILATSLGEDECKCYVYEKLISRGFYYLLSSKQVREPFLEALGKQGTETLGLTQDEFGEIVTKFMMGEESYSWIDTDMEDFLIDLNHHVHWVGKTPAFWQRRFYFVNTIYEGHVNTDVIDPLLKLLELKRREACSLVDIQDRLDGEDTGEGHSETEVTFFLKIGRGIVSQWSVIYNAYFDNLESMSWNIEWRDGEVSISSDDEEFMNAFGLDWDKIREAAGPEEPSLPWSDSGGQWAIWHDDDIFGRYKSIRDARAVFDAMVDATKWAGYGSSVNIRLMRVKDDLEEDADLDDQENWEEEDSY